MKKLLLIISIMSPALHAMEQEVPNQSLLRTMEQWVTDLKEINARFSEFNDQENIQIDQFSVVSARYVSIQENIQTSFPKNFDDEKAVAAGIIKREDLPKLNASLKSAIALTNANNALFDLCADRGIISLLLK
jgi:hypothetical protein